MRKLFIVLDDCITADPGTIETVEDINFSRCCDVWFIASGAEIELDEYFERAAWVEKNMPKMLMRFASFSLMNLIATDRDTLVSCKEHKFPGVHIDFSEESTDWRYVVDAIEMAKEFTAAANNSHSS